jgi:beta-lactam-binding protein with PASTA domain
LARAVESDAAATRTGLMMGTVAYCSPEQITQGRADQRSDVYSAGVVLFELLTGKPPYHGESAMNVAYQHVHSRVPAPSSRVKGIPSEIDELVVTATDSDPEARPRDAGALLAELADVRTELALPVVPVPPRPRTRPNVSSRSAATGHTTDVLRRSPAPHDTSLVPSGHDTPPPRDPHAPPPPVVTPPPKQRRPVSARTRRRRRALVLLIVLVLLGLGAGYAGWWFAAGRYGRIPNVVSEARSVAVQDLRHAGYQVSRNVTTRYSESVPTGSVVATDPSVGSRLQRGKTVTLVVSKGKERYRVPSVANDTVAQAKAAFAGMPVQVDPDPVREADDTVPSGKVIRTDPAAGTSVKRDATIKLIVSTGPPIIGIPNIDPGTPADQAEQTLQRAGFKTTRTEEFSDTIAKGDVIGIDPSGSARKFSTITITVSKGPRTVVIPEIAQLTPVADAKAQLEKLGLVVKVEKAFGGQSGLVVGVDPPSGTSVPVGTKVTLTII